jgi:hypothetical protein
MDLFILSHDRDPLQDGLADVQEPTETVRSHTREITPGMSPDEAADIASDKLVAILRHGLQMDTWADILKKYRDQGMPPVDLMNPAE